MATTTTVSSLANPAVYGQSVTFTATVTANTTGLGTSAGTAQFLIDGIDLGSSVALVNGSATSAAVSSMSVASHIITVVYSGGATSRRAPVRWSRLLARTARRPQSPSRQALQHWSVRDNHGQRFRKITRIRHAHWQRRLLRHDNRRRPGQRGVSGGTASLRTASLPVGANTIKVTYSGDGNFLTSSTTTGPITINQSIIVLDQTAGGALSLSGNANIR